MNETDYKWWQGFRDNLRNTITNSEYLKITDMHAYYFNHKVVRPCKCSPKIIQSYIDELNVIYKNADNETTKETANRS
jgi:hypothetical protein